VSSGSAPAAIMIAPCTQWRRFECPALPRAGFLGQHPLGETLDLEPVSPTRSALQVGVGRELPEHRSGVGGARCVMRTKEVGDGVHW
jgi:hypothetical protein